MSDSYGEIGGGSMARIVWCVAVHQPITSNEIAEHLDTDRNLIGNQLTRLYRNGIFIRRKDPKYEKPGGQPYEYAIRVPEDSNE